ncbi:hypothetical protein ACPPVU_21215 [Mucilaginibacter sp. McL0603]|uniref:hypothetical protein n=1 Tax=Mucilaginibacter sp. McL0603 TaxID=3415670 RepID=UPI003CEB572F
MTLSNFLSKLNWRLMVIHFIACWFFIYAFQQLAFLHDIELSKAYMSTKSTDNSKMLAIIKRFGYNRIYIETLWINLGGPVGFFTGFVISLLISLKNKWYWLNSVIVFVVIFLLMRYGLLGWHYLKQIFLSPGDLFKSITAYFLTNGLIMMAIGLCLFFMRWSIRFINGNRYV